ncbi:MAG: GTPase [Hyphomicrobiales bacterium]
MRRVRQVHWQDVAELHLHGGGRAIVAQVLKVLGDTLGCRMAEAGEFTRRAFDQGKLDLTETEGWRTSSIRRRKGQRRQALRQMEGGLRTLVEGWRSRILELSALLAAELDFSDEGDVGSGLEVVGQQGIRDLILEVDDVLNSSRIAERVRDGVRVVIAGAPNVGKSSLMNAIVGQDVAIVGLARVYGMSSKCGSISPAFRSGSSTRPA